MSEIAHAMSIDVEDYFQVLNLAEAVPRTQTKWPLRLLPQWDTYLMGHADKSWTTPVEAERKLVWRGQAVVAAGVFVRGRIVGEWRRQVRGNQLDVAISPLSGWRRKHLASVKREAAIIATHLGLKLSAVTVDRP